MRKDTTCLFLLAGLLSVQGAAQNKKDNTHKIKINLKGKINKPSVVAHTLNTSTQEAEAG